MRTFLILMLLASFALASAAEAAKPRIGIKIEHPLKAAGDDSSSDDSSSDDLSAADPAVSIQNFSGWPLTIQFTMKNELGIASAPGGSFPLNENTGFVVFSDPDDCLVFQGYDWMPPVDPFPAGLGCPTDAGGIPMVVPSDEIYFEFSADTDSVGVEDLVGNPKLLTDLAGPSSSPPLLDLVGGTGPTLIGPTTGVEDPMNPGTEIVDGIGFGADDDLPGAVIIAKHGPGIVYDSNGLAVGPLSLRNLAGFINSVSYELNNTRSRTTIIAHMNVPSLLIAPVVIHDDNYMFDAGTSTDTIDVLWRIDGANEIVQAEDVLGEPLFAGTFNSYPKLVDEFRYEVSVMAVSGIAPDVVVDWNSDQVIDETDLEGMGYVVLGKKKTVAFDLFPGGACFGGSGNTVIADLDGNGNSDAIAVCPTGPGSVSKPPR